MSQKSSSLGYLYPVLPVPNTHNCYIKPSIIIMHNPPSSVSGHLSTVATPATIWGMTPPSSIDSSILVKVRHHHATHPEPSTASPREPRSVMTTGQCAEVSTIQVTHDRPNGGESVSMPTWIAQSKCFWVDVFPHFDGTTRSRKSRSRPAVHETANTRTFEWAVLQDSRRD